MPFNSYDLVHDIVDWKDEWIIPGSTWGDGMSWTRRATTSTDNWAHLASGYFLSRGAAEIADRYTDIDRKKIAATTAVTLPATYFLVKEGMYEGAHMQMDFAMNNPDVQGDLIMDYMGGIKGSLDFLNKDKETEDGEYIPDDDSLAYKLGRAVGRLEHEISLPEIGKTGDEQIPVAADGGSTVEIGYELEEDPEDSDSYDDGFEPLPENYGERTIDDFFGPNQNASEIYED